MISMYVERKILRISSASTMNVTLSAPIIMVIHNRTSQGTYADRDIPYFPLSRMQVQFKGGKEEGGIS